MKEFKAKLKILKVEKLNNSYYGNPSYRLVVANEYGDVLVLEIALRQAARRQRIAELFWQYLPRPQVLHSLPPLRAERQRAARPAIVSPSYCAPFLSCNSCGAC